MSINTLFTTRTPLLTGISIEKKRAEILEYFVKTFDLYEQLFDAIENESAMYLKADPLRHPLIFYFGHTATFFINKLITGKILQERIDPKLESMFAVGVDEMSWDDLNTNSYDWPSIAEVRKYRTKVRECVTKLILDLPILLPISWESPIWIILMGIEHERIHVETSSVLIRQVPIEYIKPIYSWTICHSSGPSPQNNLLAVKGDSITLGKKACDATYGWDNEYGTHTADVKDFKAAKYLCSNGEFLEFVDSKGYASKKYWTDEGWSWRSFKEAKNPLFWRKTKDGWLLRLVFNEIALPLDWPVEVNYLEAKAFCNWKSEKCGQPIRLPSEDEWSLLINQAKIADQPFWEQAPGNINLEHFQSPSPVNQFKFGEFYDLIGNVWQWTETPIRGFEGFKIHPVYDDFSAPTFDLKHNIIKGGSWISTGNEAIRSARYAFRRHFYQHAGFRYISSNHSVIIPQQICETDQQVVRQCEAQYKDNHLNLPNYYQKIAEIAIQNANKQTNSALDLGCRTGRTTWELAKKFEQVTGLDFTARNIRVAVELQEELTFSYLFPEEGELTSYQELNLNELGFSHLVNKVKFLQTDFSNMKSIFAGYDLILINDILDQLHNPRHFISGIHKRLNPNGLLIVATGYDWSEDCTRIENWIGGRRKEGEQIWGNDDLASLLTKNFQLVNGPIEVPSVTRINKRKFAINNLEVTIWRKK
ncbi:MAG: 5-histidylcysteine sulfoxide synthase [Bacteroidia bacterium]|nr:5-histidylcysteine sulfoxide synthase [Bacteroidia bacterium]